MISLKHQVQVVKANKTTSSKSFLDNTFNNPIEHAIKKNKRVDDTTNFPADTTWRYSPLSKELATRGRATYQKMINTVNDPNKRDTGAPSIDPSKWFTQIKDQPATFSMMLSVVLKHFKIDISGFTDVKNTTMGVQPPGKSYYQNLYKKEASTIIAQDNKGKDNDNNRAPNRWCDIVLLTWMAITGNSELSRIIQQNVENHLTVDAINDLLPPEGQRNELVYAFDLTPEDDMFYAHLQTPNVVGAAYMM